MTEYFDLFGDPDTFPSGRRGRPAHKVTRKSRNKVKMLLALGWSNDRIANAIDCSLPTLRKHYFSELKQRTSQRDRLEAWKFEKLFEQAEKGNVGAMRELDKAIEKNDRMLAAKVIRDAQGDDDAPVPAEKIGKKEKARREAAQIVATSDGEDGWGGLLKPGYKH
ncbi:AraC family transcriptional regulator [Martelella sp. FLE1502]